MVKHHQKKRYDLEDSVNDFLFYHNNRKHGITKFKPYKVMRNMDDQD